MAKVAKEGLGLASKYKKTSLFFLHHPHFLLHKPHMLETTSYVRLSQLLSKFGTSTWELLERRQGFFFS
jgi:hypothetical protein